MDEKQNKRKNRSDDDRQNLVFLMVHKTVENNHFYCGLLLLMFMSIVTGYCSVRPEIPIYLGNIMKIYAIVSGMGFIISLAMAALDIIICALEFVNNLRLNLQENTKMEDKAKTERCKYSHPHFKNNSIEYHCIVDGWEDDKVRICKKGECESCQKFKSKYVEYPITVHEIENKPIDTSGLGHEAGSLVAIRPCAKEYNEKTYIGIYIGDLPIQILTSYKESTGQLINSTMNNPAIFVPDLKKIIYGCESWWKTIRSVDEFSKISNEDINNTWYVKLLQSMDQPEEE